MKIINLVENTKGCACENEHGLSFYIETAHHKLVMDSGASDMFRRNATLLGIDLASVDTFILSHGHYDHAGGLLTFAAENHTAKIYAKNNIDGAYYHITPSQEKYIGINKSIMTLPNLITVDRELTIDKELFLFSGFPQKRRPIWSNQELKQRVNGSYIQDDFSHEQCLVITQGERRVLLSGCAHNGILHILQRYHEIFCSYPQIVISGFHMSKKEAYTQEEIEKIRQTAHALQKTGALFYTGHCTGQTAFAFLKEIMGEQLLPIYSGMTLLS